MTCPRCGGRGRQVIEWRQFMAHYARCRLCGGTGWREIGGSE